MPRENFGFFRANLRFRDREVCREKESGRNGDKIDR